MHKVEIDNLKSKKLCVKIGNYVKIENSLRLSKTEIKIDQKYVNSDKSFQNMDANLYFQGYNSKLI